MDGGKSVLLAGLEGGKVIAVHGSRLEYSEPDSRCLHSCWRHRSDYSGSPRPCNGPNSLEYRFYDERYTSRVCGCNRP
ncbi:hypothetical protein PMG11_11114 [Penicillium brasilianum]|uniref:Uncharacterized protein n=1 Tax=Penicillium brasilianum TaxID=104259 RepID=A0A0F7U5A5_PENBI|nr:hypothetical protein PMG11_11114 [Penicillium brasilianum]